MIQPGGFDWADAGVGAGFALGLVLVAGGAAIATARLAGPRGRTIGL